MTRALALGALLLAPHLALPAEAVDPHKLIIEWPHGIEVVAATTPEICRLSAAALQTGKWQPIGEPDPPVSTTCVPGSAFAPGWDKIAGGPR